jgi:hypothetical protein
MVCGGGVHQEQGGGCIRCGGMESARQPVGSNERCVAHPWERFCDAHDTHQTKIVTHCPNPTCSRRIRLALLPAALLQDCCACIVKVWGLRTRVPLSYF